MMSRIWALPEATRSRYDLSSLDAVWHTAAPMPAWLKEAWIDWIGPEKVWEIYGGTERQGNTVLSGTVWLTHRGSVGRPINRSEEHTSELQSLMRISYAVFCLKQKKRN